MRFLTNNISSAASALPPPPHVLFGILQSPGNKGDVTIASSLPHYRAAPQIAFQMPKKHRLCCWNVWTPDGWGCSVFLSEVNERLHKFVFFFTDYCECNEWNWMECLEFSEWNTCNFLNEIHVMKWVKYLYFREWNILNACNVVNETLDKRGRLHWAETQWTVR